MLLTCSLCPAQQCVRTQTVYSAHVCHHCGNLPIFHECFPLFRGLTPSGSHVDQHRLGAAFDFAPAQQKYANRSTRRRTISVLVCRLCSLSPSPWKQALIIPCDLSLPCLGGASWNAAAVVCAVSTGRRVGRHRRGLAGNGTGLRGMTGRGLGKKLECSSCKQQWRRVLIWENAVYMFVLLEKVRCGPVRQVICVAAAVPPQPQDKFVWETRFGSTAVTQDIRQLGSFWHRSSAISVLFSPESSD